ncbi:MAG: lipopolysaccharide biosynthesis protein [Bacteroidota bacterium]
MDALKKKASKAFLWDLVGNYGGQVIVFVISIFLARLLSPEEFGLVGMAMVFIHILRVFADFGFASALIQNRNNTHLIYSSVFYLNLIVGSLFTITLFFLAPLIGGFYKNHEVSILVQWLSPLFILSGFNIVQSAILKRQLAFKKISIILLISQTISGGLAIFLAFKGYGIYALVIQQLLTAILNSFMLWKTAEWRPKFEFSMSELRRIIRFSSYIFFGQFFDQVFKQMDTLAVGKLFNPTTLGFYTRAESLNSLISKNSVTTFNRVFFPVLSKIHQDSEKFERVYFKVLDLVSIIAVFITGLFFLVGKELIIGLFGEQWYPSFAVFQVLVLKGFTYPINALTVNTFLAQGKVKANFYFGNVRRVLQLFPLLVAYFYGFDYFLYAVVLLNVVIWLLNSYFVKVSMGFSFWNQIQKVLQYLFVVTLVVFTIDRLFPSDLNYIIAMIKALIYLSASALFLIFTKSPIIEEFRRLFNMMKLTQKIDNSKK